MAVFNPVEGIHYDPVGDLVFEVLGEDAHQRWQMRGAQGLTLEESGVIAGIQGTTVDGARAELEPDGGAAQVAWETVAGSANDLRAGLEATPEMIRNLVILAALLLLLRRS